jgi:hypothetical protein
MCIHQKFASVLNYGTTYGTNTYSYQDEMPTYTLEKEKNLLEVLICPLTVTSTNFQGSVHLLKGTVSRDFSLLVFFINQFPPSPRVSH